MAYLPTNIGNWTLETIEQLRDEKVPEEINLDYKTDLTTEDGGTALDITAMANTVGGWLIYGVTEREEAGEKTGTIGQINGIALSLEKFKEKVLNQVEAMVEPHLLPPVIHAIPVGSGKSVYVVRVEASSIAPHAVKRSKRGHTFPSRSVEGDAALETSHTFKTRDSFGTRTMTVQMIGDMFLKSASMVERMTAFVNDTLSDSTGRMGSWTETGEGQVIGYIISCPMASFTSKQTLEIDKAKVLADSEWGRAVHEFKPWAYRRNLSGLYFHRQENEPYYEVQVYRDGRIVGFDGSLAIVRHGLKGIDLEVGALFLLGVQMYLITQQRMGVRGLVVVFTGIVRPSGFQLVNTRMGYRNASRKAAMEDRIDLPEFEYEVSDNRITKSSVLAAFRPSLKVLYECFDLDVDIDGYVKDAVDLSSVNLA